MLRTQIVKIGNSRGIRLPKVLIEQVGLENEVEISIQDNALILRPVGHARQGWEASFAAMAENKDDHLLDDVTPTQWDESEWEWS
jgi:antitoxin MazE